MSERLSAEGPGTVALIAYCPRCDYHVHLALPPDAIGTHLCVQCDHLMDLYVAHKGGDHKHSGGANT